MSAVRQEEQRHPAPRHVAIIADGNRRWARARGLPINQGHEAGADALKARLHDAIQLGITELTVFSFSTENWSRPQAEVHDLICMLAQRIADETPELNRQGVRMRFIGRRDPAAAELICQMRWAEELTASNRGITLCIAFDYGGRAEIIDAARCFQSQTEEEFRACLYTPEMHDPDLIIRTGGEQRLSNYLLWQAAYSELVFPRRAMARLHPPGPPTIPRRIQDPPATLRPTMNDKHPASNRPKHQLPPI
jgi:undecaprenyl diphosphate synthase